MLVEVGEWRFSDATAHLPRHEKGLVQQGRVGAGADRRSDSKRFPFQEEGRGVVRAWAEWVVSTGLDAVVDSEA